LAVLRIGNDSVRRHARLSPDEFFYPVILAGHLLDLLFEVANGVYLPSLVDAPT
jgi:hypothetical protein